MTGEQVKGLRNAQGLNREQFARALGIHPGSVLLAEEEEADPVVDVNLQVVSHRIALVYGRQWSHLKLIPGGRA